MEISEFINNFKDQFDDPDAVILTPATKFREIPEWNSLTGLMTLAMANDIYGVILPVEQMRQAQTVQDLYDMILGLLQKTE